MVIPNLVKEGAREDLDVLFVRCGSSAGSIRARTRPSGITPGRPGRATDEAQPTPPGFTVVEPRSDAVETFECRSLLTMLLVAIPSMGTCGRLVRGTLHAARPQPEQASARQRCFDALSSPVVRFEANVPVKRPVDRVPRPGM